MNYRLFGKSGLRVSELCLGTMTFGTEWGWGADKAESQRIFDTFTNKGGNFLDTANRYTEGASERFLGEFIKSERHHFVVASKYTLRDQTGDLNFAGSHRKNMMRSVEESLRRLDTEFIDLLWVHAWDGTTPIDEILRNTPHRFPFLLIDRIDLVEEYDPAGEFRRSAMWLLRLRSEAKI